MSKRNDQMLSLLEALKHEADKLITNQLLHTEMVENNVDGLLVVDRHAIIQFANKAAAKMLNSKKAKKLEGELFAFTPKENETVEIEIAIESKIATVEMVSRKIEWDDRPAMLVILRPSDDRGKIRSSLQKTTESLKTLIQASPLAIIMVDMAKVITLWSKASENAFGWSETEMRGKPFPMADSPLEEIIDLALSGTSFFKQETKGSFGLYGLSKVVNVWATPIKQAQGTISGVMLMIEDVTESRLQQQEIENALKHSESLANFALHHDTLTGLPNRILFRDRLEQVLALAQRGGVQSFSVMHFGIDQFKTINQCFGYEVGSQLLIDIAKRLELVMYEIDTVSRSGGDEFLILVHNIQDSQDASSIARKIITSMQQPLSLNGQDTFITASIGVAVYPDDGDTADELLNNANTAMYRSKEDFGRGNYHFFTQEMNSQTRQRVALENDLRHAIEHGEFHLHYQPQINISNNSIVGVEALIRWNHPTKGNIPPAEFIPASENSGLIEPIGDWVLQTACQQHRDWVNSGLPPVRVAVNLSARQFMRNDLVGKVAATLDRFDMQACHLELELTESMLMHDVENTVQTLRELKLMGVRLSIDDFGTGYSSLSYLKRFPLDTLKVDRSFIKDLGTASDNGEIARTIIAMSHALGMEVIAEGVENQLQLDFVRKLNCNIVQGYFFSKPLSPESCFAHMKNQLGSHHHCLI